MSCLSFKPDDPNILVSGSFDKTLKIWDLSRAACLSTVRGHSKDNTECICEFHRWGEIKNHRVECPVSGHLLTVSCLAFKPDDPNILVTGSYDSTLKIWDLSKPAYLSTVKNVGSMVWSLAFSPCGKTMAVGCSNGKVVIVDVATVAVMRSLRGHSDR